MSGQMWRMTWLLGFIAGSFLGSFLNVCIYRLPRDQSIVRPRSRCRSCKRTIRWYDNIPLVSFVLLGRRCRRCKAVIAWRYPLVEALTGVATAGVLHRFGVTPAAMVYIAFVAALIAASFIDFDYQIIPDEISVGGLVVGLGVSILVPRLHGTDSPLIALGWSVVGVLAGGGILYGTAIIGDFIFRKESMGGGDIKLLAMAGSILGWKLVLVTFFIAPIIALIPGLFVLLFRKSHVIPYGPFLSLALVISLFYGDAILRLSGIEETARLLWQIYGPQ
jgi:leader peptidase (prepilin peptidase)/N-methyltransferase